jgi:hypothetical protein
MAMLLRGSTLCVALSTKRADYASSHYDVSTDEKSHDVRNGFAVEQIGDDADVSVCRLRVGEESRQCGNSLVALARARLDDLLGTEPSSSDGLWGSAEYVLTIRQQA